MAATRRRVTPMASRTYAKGLVEPDVYDRIKDAEVVGDLRTFRKPTATRHRIWEATKWPQRLIPIGDAMSSVNPTYGQGMTVAACEADALEAILAKPTPSKNSPPNICQWPERFPAAPGACRSIPTTSIRRPKVSAPPTSR